MLKDNISKEHLEKAIAEIDKNGIRKGRHSSTYDLLYKGQIYPPKLVISIANRFANGVELNPSDFEGGKGTLAFSILENAGYEIKAKNDPVTELIKNYKKRIAETQLKDEIYKWELINEFKGRPNPKAADFHLEIKEIKFSNMVYAMAIAVINHLAKDKPEELRQLFINLFDESKDLSIRVESFKVESLKIYRSLGETLSHHQDERTISTYLTFHNPEKYTFYKSSFYKKYCKLIGVKEAKKNEKYIHYLNLVDDLIVKYIAPDTELIEQVKELIPEYYDGINHKLLAQDILYQMLDKKDETLIDSNKQYWLFAPGENASKWDEFYEQGIIGLGWDEIGDLTKFNNRDDIKNALVNAYGGEGSKKNDVSANDDFLNKIKLGDVIIVKKGRGELLGYGIINSDYIYDDSRLEYKHIRKVEWKLKGSWKVDFSLVLKTLTDISKYPSDDPDYSAFYDQLLGIMEGGNQKNDNRIAFTNWLTEKYGQNSGTTSSYIKAIDLLSQTLSKKLFNISDDNYFETLYNDLVLNQREPEGKYFHSESPSYGQNRFYSASIKSYREFLKLKNQTSVDVNNIEMNLSLNTILYGPPGTGKTHLLKNKYMDMFTTSEESMTREDFLKDIIQDCSWWQIIALAVMQLGKTKVSEIFNHEYVQIKTQLSNSTTVRPTIWGQLQNHTIENCEFVNVSRRMPPLIFNKSEQSEWEILINEVEEQSPELLELKLKIENFESVPNKKIERFEFLTFHQSYSYEDFIEGIKPELSDNDVAYKIEEGVFQKMCNRARNDTSNNYAIFIDEINRGNISAIFGELITLIEDDKREGKANEIKAILPYSKNRFSVPNNLYIIGTMNTADRSVEALDTALRRRFSFIEMNPEPEKLSGEEFKCTGIDLESMLIAINTRIEKLLDKDYCIGHSYFMTIKNNQEPLNEIRTIFQNKILPLLQEYFYGDWGKILLVLGKEFVEVKENRIKFLSTESYEDFEEYDEKPIYNFSKSTSWSLDSFKSIYE